MPPPPPPPPHAPAPLLAPPPASPSRALRPHRCTRAPWPRDRTDLSNQILGQDDDQEERRRPQAQAGAIVMILVRRADGAAAVHAWCMRCGWSERGALVELEHGAAREGAGVATTLARGWGGVARAAAPPRTAAVLTYLYLAGAIVSKPTPWPSLCGQRPLLGMRTRIVRPISSVLFSPSCTSASPSAAARRTITRAL